MKPLKEVAGAYLALSEAQRQLVAGAFDEAAANCRKAMEISHTMPPEEAFDHAGFDAFCHAGLAEALAGFGRSTRRSSPPTRPCTTSTGAAS